MISRKYNKRIQIWQTSKIPDGFGGYNIAEQLISSSWANVTTVSNNSRYSERVVDLGITDPTSALIFRTRLRNDLPYNSINQFVRYAGNNYVIQTRPVNINHNNTEVEFVGMLQSSKQQTTLTPIGNNNFSYTFDFQLA